MKGETMAEWTEESSELDVTSQRAAESRRSGRWPVDRLKPLLEAMLFAVADPLALRRVCDVLEGVTLSEARDAALVLQEEYSARGIRLVEVAGGWQFRTAPEHHAAVRVLFKDRAFRLTRAALETLAVIAYKQPVTRAEVESVRGVDSSAVLESLVERRIIRIAGRRDVPGRPLVYATTPYFLELFGLKDLKSLPTLAELGEDLMSLADRGEFPRVGDSDAAILPLDADTVEALEGQRNEVSSEIPKVTFEARDQEAKPSQACESDDDAQFSNVEN
jgi:segregation and condensation protein B